MEWYIIAFTRNKGKGFNLKEVNDEGEKEEGAERVDMGRITKYNGQLHLQASVLILFIIRFLLVTINHVHIYFYQFIICEHQLIYY